MTEPVAGGEEQGGLVPARSATPSPFTPPVPPPGPPSARRRWLRWGILGALVFVGTLGSLSMVFGGVRIYKISGGGMVPAVAAGDRVVTEGLTYLFRKPRRGEVVVFRTEGLDPPPKAAIQIRRIAGMPGERLRIAGGQLLVNGVAVPIFNAAGEIRHVNLRACVYLTSESEEFVVPADSYFVLGDASANSLDSRQWGAIPAKNIFGRGWFVMTPSAGFHAAR